MSANGWLEDVSKVKKYMMSDEDYEAREGTYRQWKKEQLAKDPTWCLEKAMAEKPMARSGSACGAHRGRRTPGGGSQCDHGGHARGDQPRGKRGEVKFVGKCETLPKGWWIGIQFGSPWEERPAPRARGTLSAPTATDPSSARSTCR